MNTRWMTPLLAALVTIGLTAVPASAQTFTLTATLDRRAGNSRAGHQHRRVRQRHRRREHGDSHGVLDRQRVQSPQRRNGRAHPRGRCRHSLDRPSSTSPCRPSASNDFSHHGKRCGHDVHTCGPIRAFGRRTISSRQFWAGTRTSTCIRLSIPAARSAVS